MTLLAGIDIGGTKCAVVLGRESGETVDIIDKVRFPTPPTYTETLDQMVSTLADLLTKYPADTLDGIGISCGGPLNSKTGLILSAPNLPGGWDRVDVITPFTSRFGVPAALQNDANACALAEWRWGAGRGTQNMIFLTFGTGMGAGLILDGRLYSGTNDLGGEVGHMRLAEDGPIGFGKAGSFEGFCSGGGIARLARTMAEAVLTQGGQGPAFAPTPADLDTITAEKVARAANDGDPLALAVFNIVAEYLGRGLALLIDVLNPQRIVIGSIFGRQQALLEPAMYRVLEQEAIPLSLAVCEIVPAGLGEQVGDYAALAMAMEARAWTSH
jgi:glucokinase